MTAAGELEETLRWAAISPCGKYRYELTRQWELNATPAVFVMLNPSTADGHEDDPTIRKCMGFAREWGHGGLVVVNLFTLRETHPKAMLAHDNPLGPDNCQRLRQVFGYSQRHRMPIVAAWGTHGTGTSAEVMAKRMATDAGASLQCLGKNADGSPRHPLYLPYTTPLEPWPG